MSIDRQRLAAVRTLEHLGYTYHGGEQWKPSLGPNPSPLLARIAELEGALQRVVVDVNDYERVNHLYPNPGRTECWDSVAHAKAVLQKSTNT